MGWEWKRPPMPKRVDVEGSCIRHIQDSFALALQALQASLTRLPPARPTSRARTQAASANVGSLIFGFGQEEKSNAAPAVGPLRRALHVGGASCGAINSARTPGGSGGLLGGSGGFEQEGATSLPSRGGGCQRGTTPCSTKP